MHETIRTRIKRRVRWFLAIGLLAWLSIPLWLSVTRAREQPYVPFAAMAVFASAALGMQFFVRCPKCKVRLGQIGVQVGIGFLKPTVNFCPYCGVSLDEPLPRAEDPVQSQNPIR
jgi:FtsH-binding integral membrane protein